MSTSNLSFTQGDTTSLILTAADSNGNPIDITGAVFSTQINGPNGSGVVTFGNSNHVVNPDQITFPGQFALNLSPANTQSCGAGFNKQIVTEVTIAGAITFYHFAGILNVLPEAPFP